MSWFKNPLDFAEGLLDQVDKRVSSVVGPSSQDGDSEAPANHALRNEPLKSAWDDHENSVIDKPKPKRPTPATSPRKSPARTRSGGGNTVKLPPRKLPPRTSPAPTADYVDPSVASSRWGEGAPGAPGRSADGAAKTVSTPTKQQEVSASPGLRHPPARQSPRITADRSLPASTAAADLASSPPTTAKSSTKKLPVKAVKVEPQAQQSSSPAAQSEPKVVAEDGAGWLSTAPESKAPQTAGSSPMSSASSASAAALQPPPDTSGSLQQLPRPPPAFASKPAASATVSSQDQSSPQPASGLARPTGSKHSSTGPENAAEQQKYTTSSNGNGVASHRADDAMPAVPSQDAPRSTAASTPAQQDSPHADVNADVPQGAGTEELREWLDTELSARRKVERDMSRLRDELTAAQGRAAVAEAGLAEARDHLSTLEDRAAAAEDAAAHADGAAADAQQSADGAAATAAAAASAAEARAAAAADAAAAARGKARDAMQRADLKADALRSCEARLGVVETELEEASTARDAAVAEANKLRAEVASAADRAVMQGNEAVDSLQKELNAAREVAAAAQVEAHAERAGAAEARVTAERRLEAMEGALGVAHAEASQSTRAAEEAMEALEAAEAANASLQQRLAEAPPGTPGFREPSVSLEMQARLDDTEARCRELDNAARQAHHRAEELEQELAEQRTGTARHAVQELQGQLRQANLLLAERQSMWERTAADHAARSLTLERQLAQVQDKLLTAGRQAHSGGDRRSATLSMGGEDVVPMDSLHGYYRFVSHRRFGKAFKAIGGTVDSVTAQVVAVLRRNPLVRVAVLFYVVFVHLLIYVLLGRMQHHAAASTVGQGQNVTTLSRFDAPINKIQQG